MATLHLLCGKIASGKSTLATRLAEAPNTVRLSEDIWLARLYKDQMHSVSDYVRCAALLRDAIGTHVQQLLTLGINVVLDFPANTPANRDWMRSLFQAAGVDHVMHVLNVPDEVCKARLRARNAAGEHAFAASDEQFELISRYFSTPTAQEGFNLSTHV
ncbi:AAA family ATPase [Pseudomonas sp. TE3610]